VDGQTVFRYLVMVRYYYGAPLPDYLYTKYDDRQRSTDDGGRTKMKDDRQLTTDDRERIKTEDYIRFENFLAGTGNEFIGRGAPKSGTATHILHLKQLKNPVDFMRYVKGVVFPGKEFMISKYLRQRTTDNGQRKSDTSSYHHIITSKFWWLWYPYRWWVALRAVVGLRR